ncbi:hypothetical protein JRQ81_013870 [Phrynocephalus forsythii]|uniref:Uncharacterized protein n=1 Tax=Phrynocephalus forsythii TaxID=171643 RepID=A0A9Q0Y010_9SAUR|nr:hypothetical protein JRQ81_013870 [Phrynocephalus forsythii]
MSLPVPKPQEVWTLEDEEQHAEVDETLQIEPDASVEDPDFEPSTSSNPYLISQADLNDLIRYLALSNSQAKLLGSRLQGWNLLSPGTRISVFRHHHKELTQFFNQKQSYFLQ